MNAGQSLLNNVRATVRRHGMLRTGDRVVVAVSGGADSVCLLHVLHRLRDEFGISLVVAHFDHGLRPDEDEDETQLVASLAEALSLPFESGTPENPLTGRASLEERAREARYRFLKEVGRRRGADKIALAHHLEDQAETVLMRLLRGSGPAGLGGIPPSRDPGIVRPLIGAGRAEILGYLRHSKILFLTDSSNREAVHLRNRMRLDLIPLLSTYQPRIVEVLARTAEIMRADEAWMARTARDWFAAEAKVGAAGEIRLSVQRLRDVPEAMRSRVIRLALKRSGRQRLRRIGLRHIRAVERLLGGAGHHRQVNLPGGLTAARDYDDLRFLSAGADQPAPFCHCVPGPGAYCFGQPAIALELKEVAAGRFQPELNRSPQTALLDAERVRYPLTLRGYRPGDRFVPLGMSGRRKVKDFFMDLKIPLAERAGIPILFSGERVVWVCGYRIDDRFKVTPRTERLLSITFSR